MVLRAPEVLFLCICGVVPGRRGCCLDPGVLRVTAIAEMQHARELQEGVAGAVEAAAQHMATGRQ